MLKSVHTLLCFCLLTCGCFAQELYEISCRLPGSDNQTIYKGLLLRSTDGTGFIRLTPVSSPGKKAPVYDLELGFYNVFDAAKNKFTEPFIFYPPTRDSFIYSKARFIRTISGQENIVTSSLVLWFKKNKTTRRFEPYTGPVPFIASDIPYQPGNIQFRAINPGGNQPAAGDVNQLNNYKKLAHKSLGKEYLQQFFTDEELNNRQKLTAAELKTARNNKKPVFYLISVHSGEKLCVDDAEKVTDYFEELSRFMNIRFKKTIIRDNDFNVKSITRAIQALTPGSNDIILFTYSGHGFSYREDEQNLFPQLALWHGEAVNKDFLRVNTINLEEIYNMIVAKKARLNIVVGDCCNSYVEMRRQHTRPTAPGVFGPMSKKWNSRAVAALFLETRQSYLMAAAKKGELAGSHDWYGGFFTFKFLHTINNKLLDSPTFNPAWPDILATINNEAYNLSKQYVCRDVVCGQHMVLKTGK